jgi:hypothetical protein
MPYALFKHQLPSTPTMDPHMISTLSSLHTRLTRLETLNHLAGREIHPDKFEYQMQSLETLKRFVNELNTRRRIQGLPELSLSKPFTTIRVQNGYDIDGPRIVTYALTNAARRFLIVCIFCTEIDNPIKYKIRFIVKPQYSSKNEFKSRGSPEFETLDCRNEQQVVENLLLMYFNESYP